MPSGYINPDVAEEKSRSQSIQSSPHHNALVQHLPITLGERPSVIKSNRWFRVIDCKQSTACLAEVLHPDQGVAMPLRLAYCPQSLIMLSTTLPYTTDFTV